MTSDGTPTKAPYYAVIFTSRRTEGDQGYAEMSDRMVELTREQKGLLGMESARGDDRVGITVCYWESLEDIRAWKANAEHQLAQKLGRERWYEFFKVRICRVEREYGFER